jgi:hypothetical protein
MTSAAPPTEFFPGINFNASFYNLGQSAVTLDYLNSNFLRSTGYAISRAQFTLFNGTVDINENLDVSGNINASAYLLNGVPFTPSQWTTSVNDIYYTTGNVGIGKTNPTYKLDVSGNVNCNAIFTNGTQLTQYTDANVRTVLGTSAGSNMTWNTGTNKFDVASPYTDTNVRTVLSTSAGSNMTWNNTNNTFNVGIGIATTTALGTVQIGSGLSITPAGLLSANANIVGIATTSSLGVIQVGAGLNITTGGLLTSVPPIATTSSLGVVRIGTGLSIDNGLLTANAAVPYVLPIATNGILGGVKPDVDTIIVNPSTGIISLSGNDISLNGTANRAYGWLSSTSLLGRCSVAAAYSTNSLINDVVLRSANNLILQSGTTTSALVINTSNQAFFRNGVVVGGTAITSGYTLDVKGDVITSGNINLANTSRSLFWGGTNSNLGRAGAAGQFSSSSVIDDIVLRSGNRLLLQSGTGVAGMVINTDNNVFIGASTNSSDDGNVNIAIPDSTFYVRGPRTIGSTTNISFRGGLEGNANGKVRIWLSSDAAHSSYIESNHTGNGNTTLSFGTSGGNVLPTERMRIWYNGAVGIQDSATSYSTVNNNMAAGSLTIGNIGQNYGGGNQWTTNTAGLMLECADATEIAVHDSGAAVHSLMYYSTNGNITIGRNMGWGIANVNMAGSLNVSGYVYGASYVYSNGFLQGAGAGGAYRILRYDNWVRLRDPAQTTHLDFAAGRLYAHNELDVQGGSTFNAGVTFNGVVYCYNGFIIYNNLLLRLTNISSTNTDYVCVSGNTSFQSVNDKILYIANGTFTGFHRNYTDDELFDAENPEIFKNSFIGCIVISSGKIKTDYSAIEEEISEEDEKLNSSVEWKSAIGKEGIFIEDALPIVKLSRVKKDKRVFGVVGDPTRSNNSKERLIINSVGEGAICVCNTNGNIENGDYIQSSDVLGHGEKQDDDILHNYTVAKATIDCNFELNSPYYECIERPDGIRTAFIACTYHCG